MRVEEHAPTHSGSFADHVRDGLTRRPKRLSCIYFYDDQGSRLFEQICELPEYYLTRAEREIIAQRSPEIARRFGRAVSLIELGSGSASKTAWLIDALLAEHGALRYLAVDLSRNMLVESCARLAARRPGLTVCSIAADYHAGLRLAHEKEGDREKLIAWLGSSIGNFHRPDAAAFLAQVRGGMSLRDRLLVGIDLRKDPGVLERAYDDKSGVTARFNLNLLSRINRELGGRFDLARFAHRARFDERAGCVSMFLVTRAAQRVAIDPLQLQVDFDDGEAIHTESSYKYSPEEIDVLAAAAGFAVEERWFDRLRRFSLNLLAPLSG